MKFLLTVTRWCFCVDPNCYFCLLSVYVMLSCLFIAALLSPAGKRLTSWLSCMCCFLVFLSLSHVVSWVRCGSWLYRSLIFAFFLTLVHFFFEKNDLYENSETVSPLISLLCVCKDIAFMGRSTPTTAFDRAIGYVATQCRYIEYMHEGVWFNLFLTYDSYKYMNFIYT